MNEERSQKHKKQSNLAKENNLDLNNPDQMTAEQQYQQGLIELKHYKDSVGSSLFPNDNAIFAQTFLKDSHSWKGPAYWFTLAAEQDHIKAAYYQGLIYEEGIGVKPNKDTAIYWYRKAVAGGHANAKINLELLTRPSLWDRFLAVLSPQQADKPAEQRLAQDAPSLNN